MRRSKRSCFAQTTNHHNLASAVSGIITQVVAVSIKSHQFRMYTIEHFYRPADANYYRPPDSG